MSVPAPIARPGWASVPDAQFSYSAGRAAIRALYQELALYPKPGLVSLVDNGSHTDMTSATFVRSLFSLRRYFSEIAALGATRSGFPALQAIGRDAERRMLCATGGVNTHRGAIFSLGLLAAAAGCLRAVGRPLGGAALGQAVRDGWGGEILAGAAAAEGSHGSLVARSYGAGGARAEAAGGFPHLFQVGLPAFRHTLAETGDARAAAAQAFFSLMAVLPDTNLLYRGAAEGLAFAQASARAFLAAGGALRHGWQDHAGAIHRQFVARRLSPGGSADLLAATLFVQRLTAP